MDDVGIPWGHQVAVMFQIVCALALDVPSVLQDIESLNGVSPNVSLSCEPWGHMEETEALSTATGVDGARMDLLSGAGSGRPGSVPFVSQLPGTYGHLLLAVYM